MKSNPHCYYSIIRFQLSTQFFCNHFTSSFLSLSGALGIEVWDTHLLTLSSWEDARDRSLVEAGSASELSVMPGGIRAEPPWGEVGGCLRK